MSGTDIVTAAASGWMRAWVAHEINRQGVAQWEGGQRQCRGWGGEGSWLDLRGVNAASVAGLARKAGFKG